MTLSEFRLVHPYSGIENRARNRMVERIKRGVLPEQMPAWADVERMNAVYAVAQEKTRQTGKQCHVDHVVPLNGIVIYDDGTRAPISGLHVSWNLAVQTASENSRKQNRVSHYDAIQIVGRPDREVSPVHLHSHVEQDGHFEGPGFADHYVVSQGATA